MASEKFLLLEQSTNQQNYGSNLAIAIQIGYKNNQFQVTLLSFLQP